MRRPHRGAYYFDNIPGDQRLSYDSGIPVDDAVFTSIGVLHWHIPIPVPTTDDYPELDAVAREGGYKDRNVITITKQDLGDLYEAKIKSFFKKHVHENEEIRYERNGSNNLDHLQPSLV